VQADFQLASGRHPDVEEVTTGFNGKSYRCRNLVEV
jgi:hypothetical protein